MGNHVAVMILKTTDFPGHDFDTYFRHTIVRMISGAGKAAWLYYLGQLSPNQYHFNGLNNNKRNGPVLVVPKEEFKNWKTEIVFPFGYFNTQGSVMFCQRIGQRQNSKGLCNQNYSTKPIIRIMRDWGFFKDLPIEAVIKFEKAETEMALTPLLANLMFEDSRYFKVPDAHGQIRSGKALARALSPQFALVPHNQTRDSFIFLREWPVGVLLENNKIKVLIKEFRQELVDFFAPKHYKVI